MQLDEQRARLAVDRTRCRGDVGVKGAVWIIRQVQRRLHADFQHRGIDLRRAHIDAHLMDVGDDEQAAACSMPSPITSDPTSMLRAVMTPSKGAVILAKPFSAWSFSRLALAASTSASAAVAPASFSSIACCDTAEEPLSVRQRCGGDMGERLIGLGLGEFALRGGDALVDLGRVDGGEHLARFHLGADVVFPILNIAAHLAVDRGGVKGLDVAGQRHVRMALSSWG